MSLSLGTMLAEQGKRNPAATAKLLPEQCLLQGTDEPGARVALLQSPILPVVPSPYLKKRNSPGLPVDKPHTHPFAVKKFLSLSVSSVNSCSRSGLVPVSGFHPFPLCVSVPLWFKSFSSLVAAPPRCP